MIAPGIYTDQAFDQILIELNYPAILSYSTRITGCAHVLID